MSDAPRPVVPSCIRRPLSRNELRTAAQLSCGVDAVDAVSRSRSPRNIASALCRLTTPYIDWDYPLFTSRHAVSAATRLEAELRGLDAER